MLVISYFYATAHASNDNRFDGEISVLIYRKQRQFLSEIKTVI